MSFLFLTVCLDLNRLFGNVTKNTICMNKDDPKISQRHILRRVLN